MFCDRLSTLTCSDDTARDGKVLADEVSAEASARVEHVALDATERKPTRAYLSVCAASAIAEGRVDFNHGRPRHTTSYLLKTNHQASGIQHEWNPYGTPPSGSVARASSSSAGDATTRCASPAASWTTTMTT